MGIKQNFFICSCHSGLGSPIHSFIHAFVPRNSLCLIYTEGKHNNNKIFNQLRATGNFYPYYSTRLSPLYVVVDVKANGNNYFLHDNVYY